MVDQLNSQVDFLNEQLAAREAQIRDLHAAMTDAQQGRSGWHALVACILIVAVCLCVSVCLRDGSLDRAREENAALVSQIRRLQQRKVRVSPSLCGAVLSARESMFLPQQGLDEEEEIEIEEDAAAEQSPRDAPAAGPTMDLGTDLFDHIARLLNEAVTVTVTVCGASVAAAAGEGRAAAGAASGQGRTPRQAEQCVEGC